MSLLSEYIEKIEEWDHRAFLSVYRSGFSKRTKKFAIVFSFFGSLYFWGLIWIIWFIYGYVTKDYYLLVLFTGGFDQSIILHSLIRYLIIRRNRPFITLQKEGVKKHDDFIRIPYIMRESEKQSFPSGHVSFLLFFGFVFAYYFNQYYWIILTISIVLSIIMAFSRLTLGVHFPIDVIFGFIFGLLYAFLYLGFTYIYWVNLYYWLGAILSPIIHFWL
ncbi:MAG: phosphatase PAP2 family protein [Promethearchaeota archaeon]|nr:MAG: phosphatase PAP2 family protein [Candidatus Lokiarchaeota archaeon]